jgi:hypothetical protein
MHKFSDFAEEGSLDGDKMKITDVVNREIVVTGYKITASRFRKSNSDKCLTIQFTLGDKRYILFTGSTILADQLEKYKDKMPFVATIVKIDRFYSFS